MSEDINQDIAISGEGNIVVGKGDVIINPLPPAEARLRHDLGILLKNVQTTWIKGVLEKSVHEAALLELGMEVQEEAVDNPWRMVLESPDQSRETIPRGRKIKDIFDEANGLLLILGEPGSGKTTTLLQLARDLIAGEDQAFTQPVPVILNLSTWINKQQPLDEWLVAELNSKYHLPKKDGQRWLKEHRILPLLDGLDEVKAENQAACVEKINRLVVDYGLQGLVVCSRVQDYTDLNVRLAFYRAIYLQPLTTEQIDEYLDQAGDKLASLRGTLHADEPLQSMARSPLILNIMSLAYQNTSAQDLTDSALATDKARRNHLFDTYIARMFKRKASPRPYDDEQTKQRLSWLARNLQRHNQEVFLIGGVQPSWLPARLWQWVYTFVSRLSGPLIIWLIMALLVGLSERQSEGLLFWLIGGLLGGLAVGVPIGFIDVLRFEWLHKLTRSGKSPPLWWSIINVALVSLIVGLTLMVVTALGGGLSGWILGLVLGLIFGPIFGLIFGLRGSRQSLGNDIQTVEALRWSWRKALKGSVLGLIIGLMLGLVSLIYGSEQWFTIGRLLTVLFFGLMGAPVGATFNGLFRNIIETKSVPNQVIRLSARNAMFGGIMVGLSGGLVFGLSSRRIIGMSEGLIFGLIIGLFLMLVGALWYGGLDIIQHYTLCLILIIQGYIPANYARFLDYAVDRIFLQKVGGGYRFIHRLLLEHFAEMGEVEEV